MTDIYTLKLSLYPFCDGSTEKLAPLMQKKERIFEIIKDSLFGFDILQYYFKGDNFGATVSYNGQLELYDQTVKEHLKDNYGEEAVDSWMESDISIGYVDADGNIVENKDDDFDFEIVELGISFVSVKKGDHLSKKRKITTVDQTSKKR